MRAEPITGHIAVDLDGTLAYWPSPSEDIDTIGEPIPAMVSRVKAWLLAGGEVRIFTSRVNPLGHTVASLARQELLIRTWCHKHLGRELQITCCKDLNTVEIWDDRAVSVEPNTGRIRGGEPR